MNLLKDRGIVLAAAAGAVVTIVIVASLVVIAPAPDVALASIPPPSAGPSRSEASFAADATLKTADVSFTPSPTPPTVGLDVGDLAPDFEVPGLDGTELRLSNYRGRPVWLNLWASWCPACRTEMPRIEGIYLEHAAEADGLVVLGIAINDSQESARSFAGEVGATYPLGLDQDGAIARLYRGVGLPVNYWIARDGTIRDWAFGEIPPDLMASALEKILR